jgi:multimeric flavodoxin WrbA
MASPKPTVRKLDVYQPLDKTEFRRRFFERFADPAFDAVSAELDKVFEVAWEGFIQYRKSPRKRRAGPDFANPDYELSVDWIQARERIREAERRFADAGAGTRILLVNGSTRSEHTCPGEASKTRRLLLAAKQVIEGSPGSEVDVLDLSELAYEPLKVIHPCKACVSTAMPLCHWPCSCYPNHAMGQTNDWMNDIYPRWVAAHGVMVLCPVHWYQTPASLKLMIDRLVCADGGNPDPTTTGGKDAELAKQVELSGWDYPRHLAGRAFAVVTHADAAGAGDVRRALTDWLSDIGLVQAGSQGVLDRFIGYYRPYATSHDELDGDPAIFAEVQNAAHSLVEMAALLRSGRCRPPDADLEEPRKK